MHKKLLFTFFVITILISGCEEEPLDTRATAPGIKFAFYVDAKAVKPDSALTITGKRIFEDSLASYYLPLQVGIENIKVSDFEFHVDTLATFISVGYSLSLEKDVDRISYNAYNPMATGTNLDSLIIEQTDTLTNSTDEAIIHVYF